MNRILLLIFILVSINLNAQSDFPDLKRQFLDYRKADKQDSALFIARKMNQLALLEQTDTSYWFALSFRYLGNPHNTWGNKDSTISYWKQSIDLFEKYHVVGWMKRFSEIVCEIYSKKIKNPMKTIVVRPGNLYGPHDKFDPEKAKVIPSLIAKIVSRENPINVWGNGRDLKDFLYIEDFCRALVKIVNFNKDYDIFNIASGKSITVQKVLKILMKIENLRNTEILYDLTKPTMIPKRLISVSKMKKKFGYKSLIPIEEGLTRTLNWYKEKKINDRN